MRGGAAEGAGIAAAALGALTVSGLLPALLCAALLAACEAWGWWVGLLGLAPAGLLAMRALRW